MSCCLDGPIKVFHGGVLVQKSAGARLFHGGLSGSSFCRQFDDPHQETFGFDAPGGFNAVHPRHASIRMTSGLVWVILIAPNHGLPCRLHEYAHSFKGRREDLDVPSHGHPPEGGEFAVAAENT